MDFRAMLMKRKKPAKKVVVVRMLLKMVVYNMHLTLTCINI